MVARVGFRNWIFPAPRFTYSARESDRDRSVFFPMFERTVSLKTGPRRARTLRRRLLSAAASPPPSSSALWSRWRFGACHERAGGVEEV